MGLAERVKCTIVLLGVGEFQIPPVYQFAFLQQYVRVDISL